MRRKDLSRIRILICIGYIVAFYSFLQHFVPSAAMQNVYRVSKQTSKKLSPSISAVLVACPRRSPPGCEPKMMVNLRVSPSEETQKVQKYLVLDEAYDQKRQAKAKLMSPYVIEVTRGEPVLMYPLQFSKSIRCDCEQGGTGSSGLREEAGGFSNLKGQAGFEQEQHQQLVRQPERGANKDDIRMASNENAQEVKDHLTDRCLMNVQDLMGKARINQAVLQRVAQGKPEKVKEGNVAREETANIENSDSTSSGRENKDEANVPPFLAKIHIGVSNDKQIKRSQVDGEQNRKLLEELSRKGENVKKDVLRSLDVPGLDRRLSESYMQPKRCDNCIDCKNGPCAGQCSGSGPCSKECQKCLGGRISQVAPNRNDEYEQFPDKKFDQQQTGRDDDDENDDDDEEDEETGEREGGRDKELMRKNDLTIQKIVDESSNSYDRQDSQDDISANDVSKIGNAPSNSDNMDMEGDDWTEDSPQSGGSPARYRAGDFHKYPRFNAEYSRNQRYMMNGPKVNYRANNAIDDRRQGCLYCNPPGSGKCAQVGRMKIAVTGKDVDISTGRTLGNSNRDIRFPLLRTQSSYVQDKITNNFPFQRLAPDQNEKSFLHSSLENKNNALRDVGDVTSLSGGAEGQLCPRKNSQLPQMSFGGRNEIASLKDHKMLQSTQNYHPNSDLQPLSESGAGISLQGAPANGEEIIDLSHSNYAGGAEEDDDVLQHSNIRPVGIVENEPNIWGPAGGIYASSDNNFEGSPQNNLYNEGINGNLENEPELAESGEADDLALADEKEYDKSSLFDEKKPFFYDIQGDTALPQLYDYQHISKDNFLKAFNYDPSQPGSSPGIGIGHQTFGGNPGQKIIRETFHTPRSGKGIGALLSTKAKLAQQKYNDVDKCIIYDPNLDTSDKMKLMDVVVEPTDKSADERFIKNEPDIENGYIPYDLAKTDRMPVVLKTRYRRLLKRSYTPHNIANKRNAPEQMLEYQDSEGCPTCNCGGGKKTNTCKNGNCRRDTSCGPCKNSGRCKTGNCKRAPKSEKKGGPCKTGDCGQLVSKEENSEIKRKMRSVSDVWYTVLNTSVPLPFLTTRVQIFRKKENSWWKIAPSITLTSLSGIYANANLSILFSSHVEMYSFDKPLIIKNHRLMLPSEEYNKCDKCNGQNILAVDNNLYNLDTIDPEDKRATRSVCEAAFHRLNSDVEEEKNYRIKRSNDEGIYAVQDFGYFPTQMNILQKCPNDSQQLCLNILDTEVPAFSVKMKFPFRDNALVPHDYFQVRITNIFADATTPGALLATIIVVNEALISHQFTILITNCKITCGGNNKVERILAPHIGEKVTFLLPLQEISNNIKFKCDVQVKSDSGKLVASRQMMVQPTKRCVCVWHCACHCIPELESTVIYNACQLLPASKEKAAGFGRKNKFHFDWRSVSMVGLLLLVLILLLGLIKALLGCCSPKVNRWKYDDIQPRSPYDTVSRCYRFFINSLFFFVFPFVCCCKRYTPVGYEDYFSQSGATIVHKPEYHDDPSDEEETILSQHISTPKSSRSRRGGGFDTETSRTARDYFCDLYNDDEEEQDTGFVLNALAESRESFKLMDGHRSEEMGSADPRATEAAQFVRELVAAKIVYRTLHQPVGNASVPPGQSFSIRGYFLPAAGPGYQFITHIPLRQHWSICPDINTLRPIIPPIMLFSKEFTRSYAGRLDVLEAGDLSVRPSVNAPCINVLVQDISMYHQPDPDDLNEEPEDVVPRAAE